VIEELRAGLDQPWGRLMRDTNRTAFERHPYGNPVIGWLEDVETASVADMENYYRQHYCPSNATLVVVGDFTTSEVLDSVEREFGGIAAGERAAPTPDPEPPQTGERRFASSWPSDVSRLAIAFHAPAVGHPDSYALQLLAAILADGKASRLYQRLVEGDRSATFVSADYSETLDDTLFYIRAETRGRGSRGDLEAAIFEEVDRIAREGVAGRDLERARHQIEAHYVFSMERPLDQAMLLGQIETLTTLAYIDRYIEHVARVDSDRVRDVCSRYLREANRTVGWLVGDRAGGETP
jgi:zinc protease